jgi:hypothetical protein
MHLHLLSSFNQLVYGCTPAAAALADFFSVNPLTMLQVFQQAIRRVQQLYQTNPGLFKLQVMPGSIHCSWFVHKVSVLCHHPFWSSMRPALLSSYPAAT